MCEVQYPFLSYHSFHHHQKKQFHSLALLILRNIDVEKNMLQVEAKTIASLADFVTFRLKTFKTDRSFFAKLISLSQHFEMPKVLNFLQVFCLGHLLFQIDQ